MSNATRYSIAVRQMEVDGEMLFEARVKEFPDLVVYESDHIEAYESALAAVEDSLEMLASDGTRIPAPCEPETEYSGRVTLRLPKSIHKALAQAADADDCSLNQYIVNSLCENIGFRRAQEDVTLAWRPQAGKARPRSGHLTLVRAETMPEKSMTWAK